MTSVFLATNGRIVLADSERVYVADGFGGQIGFRRVTAFTADTGEIVWQRSDLTGKDNVFLQAIVDETLIVNGQFDTVTSVDSATGNSHWTFALPQGYGAVGSVAVGEVLVVTAEAPSEGDIRPPLVYGLNLADGTKLWETPLVEGTDLQWHSPPVADGVVIVTSTLSHPGSASGNMVHAVETSSGKIRWVGDLGGVQGFFVSATLVTDDLAIVRTPEGGIAALRLSNGAEVWRHEGATPLAIGNDGDVYAVGEGILILDSATGAETQLVDPQQWDGFPIEAAIIQDEQLITTGRAGVGGYDLQTGQPIWHWYPGSAVDLAAVTKEFVAVPTGEPAVTVIDIP